MKTEKVHLRTKKKAKGMIGLFLDYSINGRRQQETLIGFNIYERPKNLQERDYNKDIESQALRLRNKREEEILDRRHGEIIVYHPKMLLVDLCLKLIEEKSDKTSTKSVWISMLFHLRKFDKNTRLIDITENWQERWKKYLLEKVSNNSAHSYNNKVRTAINEAVTRKYINSIRLVSGIKYKEVKREYLTENEIKLLLNEECDNQRLKEAFIFSCFTGLRNKNTRTLTWEDVTENEKGTFLYFNQCKNDSLENLPINPIAVRMLGNRGENKDLVFKKVKCNAENNNKLAIWILKAGIRKKITYHCSRHTYAVLLLERGTDIYTVAKMLGHIDMKSTLIYLKFTDKLKLKAMNSLPNFDF